jgi:hypothetical protein
VKRRKKYKINKMKWKGKMMSLEKVLTVEEERG